MRKILSALVLLSLVVVPQLALAQAGPQECCKLKKAVSDIDTTCTANAVVGPSLTATCDITGGVTGVTQKWGLCCLINTINVVVDWIFVVLIALASVFVILGAFNIMMAAGDPAKIGTGRNYIMYAAIGLLVAFVARVVPSIVKAVLGY